MKSNTLWIKRLTVLLITLFFTTTLYAVDISLEGSIIKINGDRDPKTCHTGDIFRLPTLSSYKGQALDLLIKVTAEENEADTLTGSNNIFRARPCIGVANGLVETILRDRNENDGNDLAFMDLDFTVVKKGSMSPLALDALSFSAFDLDRSGDESLSDDIYLASPSHGIIDSSDSLVSLERGNYGNGYDIKLRGNIDKNKPDSASKGNCNDSQEKPQRECRGGGVIESESVFRIRVSNDNAFGKLPVSQNIYYRLIQISLDKADLPGLGIDHGDMPESYGDAYHDVNVSFVLGNTPADGESVRYSADADADDNDAAIDPSNHDDEDAVSLVGATPIGSVLTLTQGYDYDFNVTTVGNGYINVWADYNRNGSFDAGEQIVTDQAINSVTITQTLIPIMVPADSSTGKSYIRFRFSQNPGIGAAGDGGFGEVEDYVFQIIPSGAVNGHVYNDKNGNATQDAGEPNLANVSVIITAANGEMQTVTTNINGDYTFSGVAVGTASINIDETTLPAGVIQTEGSDPTDVTVTADQDSFEENNGYQLQANLVTAKTVDKPKPQEGDTVVYTLSVINNGPSQAGNIGLTDKLPTGVRYVSHTGDGTYTSATGEWMIDTLNNGESATLKITATVNQGTGGQSIVNITTPASTPDANDPTPDGDDLNETIKVGAVPTVSISDVSVTEGKNLVFDITLSTPSNFDTVIQVHTVDGTAYAGTDYMNTTLIVTIPAGNNSAQVTVASAEDTTNEPTETFTLQGTVTSSNTQNTDPSGTGTILDNDGKPTVTINGADGADAQVTEGDPLVFDINLSNPSTEDVVIELNTTDGTAHAPDDYTETVQTVTIPAGSTGISFTVPTIDDTIDEADSETMTLQGTITSGNTSNEALLGTGTILDNDVDAANDTIVSDKSGVPASINVLENDGENINPATVNLIPPNGIEGKDTDGDGDIDAIIVHGEGTWSVDNSGVVTFTPVDGYTADPTAIGYIVEDDQGNVSNHATISADYPQSATQANDDNLTGKVGENIVANILENDKDEENDINVTSVNFIPPNGIKGKDTDGDGDIDEIIVPGEGTWSVDDSGVVTFIPEAGFTGDPTPINYTVKDDIGAVSNVAVINIDLLQELRDDHRVGIANRPIVIMILENDDEVNASGVSLHGPNGATHDDTDGDGDIDKIIVPGEGTWNVDTNGVLTFTPEEYFTGDLTPITYDAQDYNGHLSAPATVTVQYVTLGLLEEPKAYDDNLTVLSHRNYTEDASVNDKLGEGTKNQHIYHIIDTDSNTTLIENSILKLKNGVVRMDKHGIYTYKPYTNAVGTDTFRYIMEDAVAQTSQANVHIFVNCASSQKSDSAGSSIIGIVLMLFSIGITGIYFIRNEKEAE